MAGIRRKVVPDTVAYADGESRKLVVEFAIPGVPTESIDVELLQDSIPSLPTMQMIDDAK